MPSHLLRNHNLFHSEFVNICTTILLFKYRQKRQNFNYNESTGNLDLQKCNLVYFTAVVDGSCQTLASLSNGYL